MPAKTPTPKPPEFQKQPPPGTPLPMPDLSDMDKIHRSIRSDRLADIFVRMGAKRG